MDEKIQVPIYFEVKNYDKLLERLNKLSEIQDKLSAATLGKVAGDIEDRLSSLLKTTNSVTKSVDKMIDGLNDIPADKIQKVIKKQDTSSFAEGMKKAVDWTKKLGFALLTVRGVWFAIRKSMSAYLAQNEELSNKLSSLYYAVGSIFAPILEVMVNALVKIVAYVNEFVKALGFAGINMSKLEENTNKTNKALATFDELMNLSSDSDSSYTNPFENITLNQDVVDMVKQLGKQLKVVIDNLKELWTKIDGTISLNFSKIDISGTDFTSNVASALSKLLGFAIGVKIGNSLGVGFIGTLGLGVLVSTILTFADAVASSDKSKISEEILKDAIAGVLGLAVGALTGSISAGLKTTITVKIALDLIFGNKEEVKKKIAESTTILDNYSASGSLSNIVVEDTTDNTLPEYEKKKNKLHIPTLASYDVGTDYVPNDQLAYVHKGEAIIPAKYNDGNFGNGDVVAKLDQLISVVDSKDFKAYISQTDIGKASVSYINQQNRIIGGGLI